MSARSVARCSSRILRFAFCVFFCSSCASVGPACYVAVSNITDSPVSAVSVAAGDVTFYDARALPARQAGAYRRCVIATPKTSVLTWTTADGQTRRQTLKADKPIPPDFRGRLFFQIEGTNTARCLVVPDPDGASCDMPWTRPEKWEGFPAIPGLTRE
ncbi:MAG: hypothetical protein QME60_08920 [Verrucomicrobiota bacterium]|nr:hypothetical protein [Verrucomicrobiota bacterium]